MNLAGCQIQNTYLRDKQDGLLKPEAILLVSFQKNLHSVKPFLFQKKSELVFKKDSGIVKIPPRQSGKLNTLSEWRDFNMNIRILSTEQITAYDTYLRIEERAAGTREKYLRDVQAFVCWLNGAAVTKEAVTSWKERLLAEHRAPSTVNGAAHPPPSIRPCPPSTACSVFLAGRTAGRGLSGCSGGCFGTRPVN